MKYFGKRTRSTGNPAVRTNADRGSPRRSSGRRVGLQFHPGRDKDIKEMVGDIANLGVEGRVDERNILGFLHVEWVLRGHYAEDSESDIILHANTMAAQR